MIEEFQEFGNEVQYEEKKPDLAIFCFVNGAKVDIVEYPYLLISEVQETDGIRLCFVDAEESEDPVSLKNTIWVDVKKGLGLAVRNYLT